MNIQQLHYILALDTHRNFARAADACHVTQPTLSMMVQKLEEELGLVLFHRRPQLHPTDAGMVVLAHARSIVAEVGRLQAFAQQETGDLSGELRLGIIPTVAPTLLPALLPILRQTLPDLQVEVRELLTEQLTTQLLAGQVDVGILATPVADERLVAHPLYREPFVLYTQSASWPRAPLPPTPADLDQLDLWLLDEGHCFRDQVLRLCTQPRDGNRPQHLRYRSGSFHTLVQLVDQLGGATVLPSGLIPQLSPQQQGALHLFAGEAPHRTVQAVTAATWPRTRLRKVLLDLLRQHAPAGTAASGNETTR